MKIRHFIYLAMAMLIAGCTEEEIYLSSSQDNLIGRAVNFNTSIAEPFSTRTTYRHNGSFNEGDIMTIYRQYSNNGGMSFVAEPVTYRVYRLDTKYATGTNIELETDWKPLVGAKGCTDGTEIIQTAGDSLMWENGKTVRFRAWSRSNLSGALNSGKNSYYPDYCASGWVTVSGPTLDVPLTLNHLGCRIGFAQREGNVLVKAEICTEKEDYMRDDNSTTQEMDNRDKWSETEAENKANTVKAIYEKMCMPAGVDINNSLLNTMTSALYSGESTDFSTIHTKTTDDGIVKFGTQDADYIKTSVQRPVFSSNLNNRLYMITIPYDMSDGSTQGEVLTLPAYTRFRIYLYDVNKGDKAQTGDYHEATYHIFSLSDIQKDNQRLFPNGLELTAGNSYLFYVGYHYDKLTITPADSFSWIEQDAENGSGSSATEPEGESPKYAWWKKAIKEAIPATAQESFNPVFHIKTREEFLEFIKLVNGTATVMTDGLTLVLDPYKTYSDENPAKKDDYRWYRSEHVTNGKVQNDHKGDSVPLAVREAEGYIFYEHYHPANADQAAYSLEDYLKGPYSFFDENLNRHFTVCLDNSLDLCDWPLETIGNSESNRFRGVFDGGVNTISNIYMKDEYMFGYCYDVGIRNLKIETTHNFKLINVAEAYDEDTGFGGDIVGVSIKAPSSGNPFATSLTGSSYVVGCFYEGKAGGAMIGSANNLYMHGNMMAASGLSSGTGALLGAYAGGNENLKPQTAKKLVWGNFMVNYYDISLSPNTNAVGTTADDYRPQEYIRGAYTHVLKAKNDNLLADDVPYDKLTDMMKIGYYGLAPWKAMNYAIYLHNLSTVGEAQPCNGHYVNNTVGYGNTYPELVKGAPNSADDNTVYKDRYDELNVLKLNN